MYIYVPHSQPLLLSQRNDAGAAIAAPSAAPAAAAGSGVVRLHPAGQRKRKELSIVALCKTTIIHSGTPERIPTDPRRFPGAEER